MSKQLVINASAAEEIRVAIIEDGRLVDLDIDSTSRTKQKGNIYKGIVANVEDSLEAAFIEFGDEKQAFLALSEVRPALYPPELRGQRRPKISDVLKRGQELVVQITKDEIGSKGAAVTTYLSLPGRYVVLMHSDDSGGGVSRKIEDEAARRRARDMLGHLEVPEGQAVIIRTAGMNRPMIDLYRDLKALAKVWEQIDRGGQLGRAPTLLYREPDLVVRTVRDYLAPDIGKIVIDSEDEYEEVKAYFEERSPDALSLLERYEGRQPLFEKLGIENAIEELFERQVRLPAGGYLIIDQTEALVAIDVNSGKSTRESDHEATVYKTNLEAAREVARQLRLRDLGGIIVVDFIDMVNRRHDRDVERALRDAMRDDKARVKIGRISENGTLEITRQRLRQAHRLVSHTPCPHCAGTGVVRDPKGLAVAALRQLSNRMSKSANQLARLTVRVPVDVANIINAMKRRDLLDMSEEHQCLVDVQADVRLQGDEIRYDEERRGRAGLDAAQQIRDPRLVDGERGRRRRRREEPASGFAGQTLGPPPSIGPVPTFLADEETIVAADQRLAEDEARAAEARTHEVEEPGERRDEAPVSGRDRERAPRVTAPPVEQHFDDPLTEALFGSAPAIALADAEGQPDPSAPVVTADAEGPKKRRRRRRRRRSASGAEDATAQTSAQGEGPDAVAGEPEDDDGAGDDEDAAPADARKAKAAPPAREAASPGAEGADKNDSGQGDSGQGDSGQGDDDAPAGASDAASGGPPGDPARPRRRSRRGGRGRRRTGDAAGAPPVTQSASQPELPET